MSFCHIGHGFTVERGKPSAAMQGYGDGLLTCFPAKIDKKTSPSVIWIYFVPLEHGRIESRTVCIYRGEELIVDRKTWNGNLTVIEILTSTQKKSDGSTTSEQRLYISSLDSSAERLSQITKQN